MLEELFGDNSLIKVLDFLLENRFWEYTKKDIAENAEISRVQFYRLWETLEKYQIIIVSRRIGATSLYITNVRSPIVKKLGSLALEIADFSGRLSDQETTTNEVSTAESKPNQLRRLGT
jgi:hypothetical protein